ncbi:MAG: phosphatase PAP2 family protein [Acidobacteriota bacterium]|nr:phosphatase PAP2 family protein [Acidobacteriota bacterium]
MKILFAILLAAGAARAQGQPFRHLPKMIAQDQARIWTSPVHTAKRDVKWWVIFGGATAGLIAADRHIAAGLPNTPGQVSAGTWVSRLGAAYTLIPLTAGGYAAGLLRHDERLRNTGLLAAEALIDANLVSEAIKIAADRQRPLEGSGGGHFEAGPTRWDAGFPSGHAISTWALASVIAHQYPRTWVKVAAYGLAAAVSLARVGARRHFPGDVVAGAAMGWFIGDFSFVHRARAGVP